MISLGKIFIAYWIDIIIVIIYLKWLYLFFTSLFLLLYFFITTYPPSSFFYDNQSLFKNILDCAEWSSFALLSQKIDSNCFSGLPKPLAHCWVWPKEDTRGSSDSETRVLGIHVPWAFALMWHRLIGSAFLIKGPTPEYINIPCCFFLTLPSPL